MDKMKYPHFEQDEIAAFTAAKYPVDYYDQTKLYFQPTYEDTIPEEHWWLK